MAPSTTPNAKTGLTMKLLVDTKAQRVLYAEAGKDVVDFLFSLLTLPFGTVAEILNKDSMAGSIGNLHGSVEELDDTYMLSDRARNALLLPAGGCTSGKILQLSESSMAPKPSSTQLYQCHVRRYTGCYSSVTKSRDSPCCIQGCHGRMTSPVDLVGSSTEVDGEAAAATSAIASGGFVKGIVTYTVMDDLKVAPMSTISGITLLNTFGITDIGMLQEKPVQLGYEEVLEILRLSLQSKTVLSDVFLGKKQ